MESACVFKILVALVIQVPFFFSHLLKVLNLIAIPRGRGSKSHGELSYQEKATKQPKRVLRNVLTTSQIWPFAFLWVFPVGLHVSTRNIWTPLFKSAQESGLAPEFLIHWGHAGAMATVLLAMGGYGTFLGWSTRLGNGSTVYPLSLGQTAAALHPQLMGLALFLFFLGGQGGTEKTPRIGCWDVEIW